MQAKLYFVHAMTPLHAGTGQGVGVIDLPIAREKATGIPYLPGSSVKGVLRDASQSARSTETIAVFGPDTEKASEHAGALQVTDARLLLLPVRSLRGTYAWVTSPLLLRRFQRDGEYAEKTVDLPVGIPVPKEPGACLVSPDTEQARCAITEGSGAERMVYLEDLDLKAKADVDAGKWAEAIAGNTLGKETEWGKLFRARFCIVHDDTLGFLMETATEVVARIKIQDATKTVQRGGLWYEEALPAESILVGIFGAQAVEKSGAKPDTAFAHLKTLLKKPLQFGGNATVGRGICRVYLGGKA
jgi:CRISPR-associated protein Cmr4